MTEYVFKKNNHYIVKDNTGYPYEAPSMINAWVYHDPLVMITWINQFPDMARKYPLMEIKYEFVTVSKNVIEQQMYENAIAKLTDQEIDLIKRRFSNEEA